MYDIKRTSTCTSNVTLWASNTLSATMMYGASEPDCSCPGLPFSTTQAQVRVAPGIAQFFCASSSRGHEQALRVPETHKLAQGGVHGGADEHALPSLPEMESSFTFPT